MTIPDKIIDHRKFGKVVMVRSSRARRINISIKPFGHLKVTVPVLESFRRAEDFLMEKEEWILRNLDKIRRLESRLTLFDQDTRFSTREHVLEIIRFDGDKPEAGLRDNKILVKLPGHCDILADEIQDFIRCGIETAWRKEAQKYLPARLCELSGKYNLPFERVMVKNNKTRWGSCSCRNNINLSLHIMRLPDRLIDYILIHELVHTVHKNHSKEFWEHLQKLEPEAKTLDRELKQYRIGIY